MDIRYSQVESIMKTMAKLVGFLTTKQEEEVYNEFSSMLIDLKNAIEGVNNTMFYSIILKEYNLSDMIDAMLSNKQGIADFIIAYSGWQSFVHNVIKQRRKSPNRLDMKFNVIMDYVEYVDRSIILQNSINNFLSKAENEQRQIAGYYNLFEHMWGGLSPVDNKWDVLVDRIDVLCNHKSDFVWLYNSLEDYRSKNVLFAMLADWLSFDLDYIVAMHEGNFDDYYDYDILKPKKEAVVVDLGAYNGDSALSYIENYGDYGKIYCYEITETMLPEIKRTLEGYNNIEIRQKAAGSKSTVMYISENADASCNKIDSSGNKAIEVVAIDDDILEKIDFIKMDIEGAEQNALIGCRRHILEDRPELAVCVYHNNEDIWKVPRMIRDMREDYKLYLRSNGAQIGPSEIVLFAV